MNRRTMLTALTLLLSEAASPAKLVEGAFRMGGEPEDPQRVEKQFRVGPGKKLALQLRTGGSVDIAGWDENTVSVKVFLGGADWRDCRFEANETPSGVGIVSRYEGSKNSYSTSLRFEIRVPKNFDVEIASAGGDIKITGLEGDIRGGTMGGNLRLANLKGEVELSTMGGNVSLTESEVGGRVKTMGGRVLIENVVGRIKGVSTGGEVIYKNVSDGTGRPVSN
jgi:DUF4097 and DUF4098 domain-containing protein YvlB